MKKSSLNLQVKKSVAGLGLFAMEPIAKDCAEGEYKIQKHEQALMQILFSPN